LLQNPKRKPGQIWQSFLRKAMAEKVVLPMMMTSIKGEKHSRYVKHVVYDVNHKVGKVFHVVN
jgi:hypothetical protein